jgi:ATP-dependent RNA helicase MSS116, mitochondrial
MLRLSSPHLSLHYPLKLQVGLTTKEVYVHRLGRTGRAGKAGAGLYLLADFEAPWMLRELNSSPLSAVNSASVLTRGLYKPGGGPVSVMPSVPLSTIMNGIRANSARYTALTEDRTAAYLSLLSFYLGYMEKLGWDRAELVRQCNVVSKSWGLSSPPAIAAKLLQRRGLRGVRGIVEKR